MAYTLPNGAIANFQTSTPGVGVQTTGTLHLRYDLSGVYTPPAGGAIDFNAPVGYVEPAGGVADFFLVNLPPVIATGGVSFSVTASGVAWSYPKPMGGVRARTKGLWGRATATTRGVTSPHKKTVDLRSAARGAWAATAGVDAHNHQAWVRTGRRDNLRSSLWGTFGPLSIASSKGVWGTPQFRDTLRKSAWGSYGPLVSFAGAARWVGSVAADETATGFWRGHLVPLWRKVPYPRPLGLASDFRVVGGKVDFWYDITAGYVPPSGNMVNFTFAPGGYTPQITNYPQFRYVIPYGLDAYFLYNPQYEPVFGVDGAQVLEKSSRDSGKLNPWGGTKNLDDTTIIPWLKFSRPMNPGWGIVTPGTPQPPEPGQTITIPVQRVYIVVNDILLIRAVGNVPLAAENLNISFDCDSWLPTFTATLPESAREAVMPDPSPVEVIAYINGSEFRFFVEKIVRNRSFGRKTVSIAGRGIACELDAPFATASQHTNTVDKTAQQLIDAALTNTTYTQTWGITDWLVPADTFSLFGTPAAVAGAVAEASGSVLQADWATRDLRMLPRYAVKPWDWATATPDYVIPASIAETESLEWLEKPDYNVVYVSGEKVGVIGQVKITGTAGDKPAPMVTSQLITHADAARQRGISILSDTGRKAMMQLSLPVLDSTGVIDVCRLIEFSDGTNTRRGIVRANNVSVNWPTVRQTLTIEAAT